MGRGDAVGAVVREAGALARRLRALEEAAHGRGGGSAAERALLRDLAAGGPRTVPDLARSRGVRRQSVQALLDRMASEGLVERLPGRGRSPLHAATPFGRDLLGSMLTREEALLAAARPRVSAARLRDAAAVLRDVRRALEAALPPRRA